MHPRLLIAGYYGYGNLGDEAILHTMALDLRREIAGVELLVASGDPDDTQARHGLPAVASRDLETVLGSLRQSDLVIIGGGGLFHDYWPVDPGRMFSADQTDLEFFCSLPGLAKLAAVPCVAYGIGVGPLGDAGARMLTRSALAACEWVSVRDQDSAALATELLAGHPSPPPVEIASDPALGLTPGSRQAAANILRPTGVSIDRPLVAAVLRPWTVDRDPGTDLKEISGGLALTAQRLGASVLLIPFQRPTRASDQDDLDYARRVRSNLTSPEQAAILEIDLTPEMAAGVLAACDVVLAERYHAALLALMQGIPCVSLDCDPKLTSLMEACARGEFSLAPDQWQAQTIADRLLAAAASPADPSLLDDMRARAGRPAEWIRDRLGSGQARGAASADEVVDQAILNRLADAGRMGDLEFDNQLLHRQLERMGQERQRLGRELAALRSTRGVRWLGAYWGILHWLLPVGSQRREWARTTLEGVRRIVVRIVHPGAEASIRAVTGPGPEDGAKKSRSLRATDPRIDLLAFEAHAVRRGHGPLVAVVTTTQLVESEGQRSTRLVLELARRRLPVIHAGWRWHTDELVFQDRLQAHVLQFPFDLFIKHFREVLPVADGLERVLLIEFPHPALFEILAVAGGMGWLTVYDLIDDWSAFHAAGQAPWYDPAFESHLLATADLVSAVSPALAERARGAGRAEVLGLPNAAPSVWNGAETPIDLEQGEKTIGYFGHLTPAWFDWNLIEDAARVRPSWRFHLIGDRGPAGGRRLPENVMLLGRQPQAALPAFARNWDAAIVPFRAGRLAEAVDAIKTYEYLSLGLPTVVTGVHPPEGAESLVRRAEGTVQFVRALDEIPAGDPSFRSAARAYAAKNTWSARVDRLLASLAAGDQRVALKRALFAPAS